MRRIPARWSRRVRSASDVVGVALWLVGVALWLVGVALWLVGVALWLVGVALWLVGGNAAWGGEARISVASNFAATVRLLGDAFAAATGHVGRRPAARGC